MSNLNKTLDVIDCMVMFTKDDPSVDTISTESEMEIKKFLGQVMTIVQKLMGHDFENPFKEMGSAPYSCDKGKELRRHILDVMSNISMLEKFQEISEDVVHSELCPSIQILLSAFRAANGIGVCFIEGKSIKPLEYLPESYCSLNKADLANASEERYELFEDLRSALLSKEQKAVIKSFRRNSTERYKQIMYVAQQAWEKSSRNLLIRLDWGYRKEYDSKSIAFSSRDDFTQEALKIDAYRKTMLEILRGMFPDTLSFYVWKIECGDIKGLHIHWMIALNGAKHQDRINVARSIADSWDAAIGNGQSYTFNINGLRLDEDFGLRVLEYNDPKLWDYVGLYADYLTKVDYTVKLKLPDGMRAFGCSKLKTVRHKKPGRLRSKTETEMLLHEVRGPQGKRLTNSKKKG